MTQRARAPDPRAGRGGRGFAGPRAGRSQSRGPPHARILRESATPGRGPRRPARSRRAQPRGRPSSPPRRAAAPGAPRGRRRTGRARPDREWSQRAGRRPARMTQRARAPARRAGRRRRRFAAPRASRSQPPGPPRARWRRGSATPARGSRRPRRSRRAAPWQAIIAAEPSRGTGRAARTQANRMPSTRPATAEREHDEYRQSPRYPGEAQPPRALDRPTSARVDTTSEPRCEHAETGRHAEDLVARSGRLMRGARGDHAVDRDGSTPGGAPSASGNDARSAWQSAHCVTWAYASACSVRLVPPREGTEDCSRTSWQFIPCDQPWACDQSWEGSTEGAWMPVSVRRSAISVRRRKGRTLPRLRSGRPDVWAGNSEG